jgi:uncharacterized protein YbjT (DUF2867 family)
LRTQLIMWYIDRMKKHTILVTGASGNVGKALVEILRHTQHHVIATYHNNKPAMREEDVEYRQFDITDSSTFEKATEGVDKIFLVRPPQIVKIKREVLPFLHHIKEVGIKHVVFLSVQGVEENPIIPHAKIETDLNDLSIPHTSIRPCYFMQNLTTTHLDSIKEGLLSLPSGEGKTSFIDVRDIAAIAAIILKDSSWIGKHVTLTHTTSMSFNEAIEIINNTCNLSIRFKSATLLSFFIQQKRKNMPLGFILVMYAIYSNVKHHKADIITLDASSILQRELITLEQFSKEHCSLFKGKA